MTEPANPKPSRSNRGTFDDLIALQNVNWQLPLPMDELPSVDRLRVPEWMHIYARLTHSRRSRAVLRVMNDIKASRGLDLASGIMMMADLTRRGYLPNGEGSRGFVMVELELITARVSPEALAYLLAFRRRCYIDENDGVMSKRQAVAVADECGFPEDASRVTKGVTCHNVFDELQRAGWLDVTRDTVRDRGYLTWGDTKLTRQLARNGWRQRKRNERDRKRKQRGLEAAAAKVARRNADGDVTA